MNIDFSQLTAERVKATGYGKAMRARAWVSVRKVSFDVERMIKIKMPVDTGRARASWGHSSAPATGEGIWQEDVNALAITQGSRVEYIKYLNEGHSQQAPAGFIDAEKQRGLTMLEKLLGDDMENVFK